MQPTSITDTIRRGNDFIARIKEAPGKATVRATAKAKAAEAKAAARRRRGNTSPTRRSMTPSMTP